MTQAGNPGRASTGAESSTDCKSYRKEPLHDWKGDLIYNFNVAVSISINFQGFRKNTPCLKGIKGYEKEVFDTDIWR